ncbi:MAG TPA: SUMF1/EgtB/PvdO family nonheme iron enzyme [Byssovorax sp.]
MRRSTSIVLVLGLVACGRHGGDAPASSSSGGVAIAPKGKVLEAAEDDAPDAGVHAKKPTAFGTGERAEIPGGKVVSGSTPGDKGRDPTLEPADVEVELGGFSIDKYLYPNDPQRPPLTGVTRAKAAELCQQASARLCTELEWERACKGPDDAAYAGSAGWDPACAKSPLSCASGFGVLGMGANLREWTASDVLPIGGSSDATKPDEGPRAKAAAARGARGDAAGVDHRCAHRMSVDPTASGDDLGFRCCHGPPNAPVVASPAWQQTFRKAQLTPKQAAEMFATVPQLATLGPDITYFKEPDDVRDVLARGDAGVDKVPNTSFTTQPLLWSPVPGEEILVVAGRAKKQSFIVAFDRLPGDRYRIAASFVLKDEKGPIVLGYNSYVRKKLAWALTWDGRGDSGNVTYRDDNRVVITQK